MTYTCQGWSRRRGLGRRLRLKVMDEMVRHEMVIGQERRIFGSLNTESPQRHQVLLNHATTLRGVTKRTE